MAQVGDLITGPIRQAVHERSLRASEHSVRITTAMLGRRSSLIGALVQAVSVAIHTSIEQRNHFAKNMARPLAVEQIAEPNH